MIFKTLAQISHLCFLKIHKFFIYSSWKLKIIFKTFATNFTFIIFMSHTLSWDRKNLLLIFLFIYFPLLELENSLFSSSRARKQIFRPPNYEFLLFCMEWKLNNYKGKVIEEQVDECQIIIPIIISYLIFYTNWEQNLCENNIHKRHIHVLMLHVTCVYRK